MTRRSFLMTAGATVGLAAVAGCGAESSAAPESVPTTTELPTGVTRRGNMFTVDLDTVRLGTGSLLLLLGAEVPVLLVRPTASDYAAYDARCPHAGSVTRWSVSDAQLVCATHGSRFALASGALALGPATSGLRVLSVTRRDALLTIIAA